MKNKLFNIITGMFIASFSADVRIAIRKTADWSRFRLYCPVKLILLIRKLKEKSGKPVNLSGCIC